MLSAHRVFKILSTVIAEEISTWWRIPLGLHSSTSRRLPVTREDSALPTSRQGRGFRPVEQMWVCSFLLHRRSSIFQDGCRAQNKEIPGRAWTSQRQAGCSRTPALALRCISPAVPHDSFSPAVPPPHSWLQNTRERDGTFWICVQYLLRGHPFLPLNNWTVLTPSSWEGVTQERKG